MMSDLDDAIDKLQCAALSLGWAGAADLMQEVLDLVETVKERKDHEHETVSDERLNYLRSVLVGDEDEDTQTWTRGACYDFVRIITELQRLRAAGVVFSTAEAKSFADALHATLCLPPNPLPIERANYERCRELEGKLAGGTDDEH